VKTLERCPVCEDDRIHFLYSGETTRGNDTRSWSVSCCHACSHGFMNPQPSWVELTPYYHDSYEPYETSHGATADDDRVIAEARKTGQFRHITIKPGDRILDVGCGGGYFLRIANALGAVAEGVEPHGKAVERAREQGLTVFHGALEDFATTFPEKRFDVITANHVVEHVPNPVDVLSVMKSLLAPGGFTWISVPNADCPFCRTLGAKWHSTDLPIHVMQWTPRKPLASELAGLVVDSVATYSLPHATAYSLRLVLRHRYLVPVRLSDRVGLIDRVVAPRLARRLDAATRGEAIIIRLKHPEPRKEPA